MSFSRSTGFSMSRRSGVPLGPSRRLIPPPSSAVSVYAGAGGSGSRISLSRTTTLSSSGGGYGAGYGGSTMFVGSGVVTNEKETMQDLNERLATYLEKVRNLEQQNRHLELQIREFLAKKGPSTRDWSHQWEVIEELQDKIFEATVGNARTVLQIDNARLAADDFRVKWEAEVSIRTAVERDSSGLRAVMDETNITRMQLEGEIEALREELILMRKNHEEEVQSLQAQVSSSGLTVEVDAPKSQDLGKVLGELRAQYDALAQKNLEELEKQWGRQITESTLELTQSTREMDTARSTLLDLRRTLQTLELDLESLRNQKMSLESNLVEVEERYGMQLEQLQGRVLRSQEELGMLREELRNQAEQHRVLLNIKGQLEAEIATYRHLLEGGEEFSLQDALEKETTSSTTSRSIQRGGEGKVVLETKEVKVRSY